jgi:hypothetical protein
VQLWPSYLVRFPVPVAPHFLPNLEFATQVSVRVWNPEVGQVLAVPGFKALRQIVGLTVLSTQFVDLTSFSGLQCPPASFGVARNKNLTSLTGLEGMAFSANYTTVNIVNNPLLKPASAFAPLPSAFGCKGSRGLASAGSLYVGVDGCSGMTTFDAFCSYVTSPPGTTCPS